MIFYYYPLKQEAHRSWLVVGSDKLPYASDSTSMVTNLIESKIF